MSTLPVIPVQSWMQQIFDSKAARQGGVVRRNLRDIDREVGREWLLAEVHRRGFHAVENAGQIVIFCNNAPVRILR